MLALAAEGIVFPDGPGRTVAYVDRRWGDARRSTLLATPGPPVPLPAPGEYVDAVTGEPLTVRDDPLLASDGHTYAASTLRALRFPFASPLTRETLRCTAFRNRVLHALHGEERGGAVPLYSLRDVGNCTLRVPIAEVESGDCWAWLLRSGWGEEDCLVLHRRSVRDGFWGPPPLPLPDEVVRHVARSLHLVGDAPAATTWCAFPGSPRLRLLEEWIAESYPGLDEMHSKPLRLYARTSRTARSAASTAALPRSAPSSSCATSRRQSRRTRAMSTAASCPPIDCGRYEPGSTA